MLIPTKGNVIVEKISDSQFYQSEEPKGKVITSASDFIQEGDIVYFTDSDVLDGFTIVNDEKILAYERN